MLYFVQFVTLLVKLSICRKQQLPRSSTSPRPLSKVNSTIYPWLFLLTVTSLTETDKKDKKMAGSVKVEMAENVQLRYIYVC